ncbi:MAG: hypothetical protein JWM05_764, partial [Acidimicrobiales bacterium]|nr:hypothetical protein [Acidimicrobiales bacterium]
MHGTHASGGHGRRRARATAVALVVVLVLAVAACGHGGPAPSGAPPTAASPAPTLVARTVDDAVFTVDCTYSHRAPDDPIVHPREPGASHEHDFFGNAATRAASTLRTLLRRRTTCEDPSDTAAYWVPTLERRGVPVEPAVLRAYYR